MFFKILDNDKAPVTTVWGGTGYTYKINEVNICKNFDTTTQHGNGFYFADEKNILNFLGYGNTLYEVELPPSAKIIEINDECKEYKTDKIIVKNPTKITPELVKIFLENGATISEQKLLGVIKDLCRTRQEEILEIIFDFVNENDAKMAYQILNLDTNMFYNCIIDKYSKTTNPEVISIIHNNYHYNKIYKHTEGYLEKIILSKIQKNIGKPIKDILKEYEEKLNDNIER